MTPSDDGLEYQCSECGMFVPASSVRCPRCGSEFNQKEETVEELLEELTSLLNDEGEDGEPDDRTSPEEADAHRDEVPRNLESTDEKSDGKVKYKRVRKWPP